MPWTRKECPVCGKKSLLRLANHLADVHQLSSEERQSHLIRARACPVDLEMLLKELHGLIRNTKQSRSKQWYK